MREETRLTYYYLGLSLCLTLCLSVCSLWSLSSTKETGPAQLYSTCVCVRVYACVRASVCMCACGREPVCVCVCLSVCLSVCTYVFLNVSYSRIAFDWPHLHNNNQYVCVHAKPPPRSNEPGGVSERRTSVSRTVHADVCAGVEPQPHHGRLRGGGAVRGAGVGEGRREEAQPVREEEGGGHRHARHHDRLHSDLH